MNVKIYRGVDDDIDYHLVITELMESCAAQTRKAKKKTNKIRSQTTEVLDITALKPKSKSEKKINLK